MKGLFIVFEGIDGSGTSTQASMLRDTLQAEARHAILTAEPSEGPIGNMIRQAMKGRIKFADDSEKFDAQMAYLFAADRHDHLYNPVDGVQKLLAEGKHVISTRYYFSSLAYHAKNADELAFVTGLNAHFPAPDLVIYLRNRVELSMQRMARRAHQDVYENPDKLTLVAQNYEQIFADYHGEVLAIDATLAIDEIARRILEKVRQCL
jgi:dTMP kinase